MVSNAIEIRGLTKRYRNGVIGNDGIDLDVPAGSVFGLLGPNGAGKTTLVRQVTGELLPTGGTVRVAGIDVVHDPMRAKRVMGVVPQEAGTFLQLTVTEHLLIFGRLHGLGRTAARERAAELLVGMALLSRPQILVLDEPTTGLDPNSRREVWSVIKSLRGEGATVLLTTHYMEEAEALCGRVAILGGEPILAMGSVEEVRALCRHRFKATYEQNGQSHTLYGGTHQEVVAEIEGLGVAEYAVAKTSLEDIYLELTGRARETKHG